MNNENLHENSLGAILSDVDLRDYKLKTVCCAANLPFEYNVIMGNVKNQGSISSCVAHALSEVMEYHSNIQGVSNLEFSTGFIYGNRQYSSHKGEGMVVRDALSAILKDGDCYNDLYNHNEEVPQAIERFQKCYNYLHAQSYPHRITKYYKVSTEDEIKTAIMQSGPVVVTLKWYNGAIVSSDGELIFDTNKDYGYHCVVIYGWTKNGWLIQNSWGKSWGRNGRCWLSYNYHIDEAWGIVDDLVETTMVVKPFSSTLGKNIAKILNIIINLIKHFSSRA